MLSAAYHDYESIDATCLISWSTGEFAISRLLNYSMDVCAIHNINFRIGPMDAMLHVQIMVLV